MQLEGSSPRDIVVEQEKDPDLSMIIRWLKDEQVPSEFELQLCSPATKHWWSCNSQLKFKDGVLVYEWLDTGPSKLLIIIPKLMKQEVLVNCHNTKIAGHFGQQKTYNKLKSRFIWHGRISSPHSLDRKEITTQSFFQNTYNIGDAVYRIDSATKVGESKKLRYARHRPSLGVPQENEDFDMTQDPDIGHDLSVLFVDDKSDNDLTIICSGRSGNYDQITNGSSVQDVPAIDAETVSSYPFCLTGNTGKKVCEHHYRVVSDLNDSFSDIDLDETFLYDVEDSRENVSLNYPESVARTWNRPKYLDDYVMTNDN
ncbi:unnamed protein product [Mytilus coruscus]|uniref:Integrase zinc-binding domain-containing protein n=1 Tax=Mytilus coruscus TaxID=42192 RepID=A0A6J8B9U3_MYTCO|nr:unnamed protein product [Mytilus coruscus]